MLRRAGVWSLRVVLALVALLLVLAVLTRQSADPALYPPRQDEPSVEIFVVSHGYHTGLALPRGAVLSNASEAGFPALINVATRFGAYAFIEIGWGEEEFYRQVPTPDSLGVAMALRALLMPGNRSVLHVVGLGDEPPRAFPASEVVAVRLSEAGFRRMLRAVDATFVLAERQPQATGPGLYGPSLFYRANGAFSLLSLCNHWTGRMLTAAGVAGSPVIETIAPGLMWSIRRQAGSGPRVAP
jgi:uncharacterized protein (TIGR02117 family)